MVDSSVPLNNVYECLLHPIIHMVDNHYLIPLGFLHPIYSMGFITWFLATEPTGTSPRHVQGAP